MTETPFLVLHNFRKKFRRITMLLGWVLTVFWAKKSDPLHFSMRSCWVLRRITPHMIGALHNVHSLKHWWHYSVHEFILFFKRAYYMEVTWRGALWARQDFCFDFNRYCWPKLTDDVARYVNRCFVLRCLYLKAPSSSQHGYCLGLAPIPMGHKS